MFRCGSALAEPLGKSLGRALVVALRDGGSDASDPLVPIIELGRSIAAALPPFAAKLASSGFQEVARDAMRHAGGWGGGATLSACLRLSTALAQ